MKYLLIILICTSCLTEKRFNKVLTKGIEKGWLDTSTVAENYVYVVKRDTTVIESKIDSIITTVFKDTTLYKDTCYSKKGLPIKLLTNPTKLKTAIEKSFKKEFVKEVMICLQSPLFYERQGVIVEVSQDSRGYFEIKTRIKNTTINRPSEKSWFQKQKDVWYLYLIIALLIILNVIKR